MSRIDVNINPLVLKWAREEAGFDIKEISEKASITIDRYSAWEESGQNIPLGKLKILSTQFKRQIAFFFLPDLPPKQSKPKDYRNLAPNRSKLSKKVLMAMRDTNYFLDTALSLKGGEYWTNTYSWVNEINTGVNDESVLVEWLRHKLEISIEEQYNWSSANEAWRVWREAVEEKLGIFVYQFSMPEREVQGFSLAETIPYAVVTNSKYIYQNRIFTLFHELAHIFRRHSSLCLMNKYNGNQLEEELKCNNFAGNFLVPDSVLESVTNITDLQKKANKLRVSREVYLRRAYENRLVSYSNFKQMLKVIKLSQYNHTESKGFVKPEVKSYASRGKKFFNLVLEGVNNSLISYTKASDLLDLKINRVVNEF